MRFEKSLELRQMELLFSHRAPIILPVERQRDLTAALADLLTRRRSLTHPIHRNRSPNPTV
jgi:hypothetical protein